MVTPQSIQRHTGLTHHFLIFDILAPESPNVKN